MKTFLVKLGAIVAIVLVVWDLIKLVKPAFTDAYNRCVSIWNTK